MCVVKVLLQNDGGRLVVDLFAALVLWMYYTIAYVPGGQPIGALERGFSGLGKLIGRRLPGRHRQGADAGDAGAQPA